MIAQKVDYSWLDSMKHLDLMLRSLSGSLSGAAVALERQDNTHFQDLAESRYFLEGQKGYAAQIERRAWECNRRHVADLGK